MYPLCVITLISHMYALKLNLLHAKVRFLDKMCLFIHENKKSLHLEMSGRQHSRYNI